LPAPLASSVLEHAVDLPAPSGGFDGNQKKEEAPSSAVSASSSNRARDTASGDVKIPKWLKLGSSKSLSMRLRSPVYLVTFFYSEK
jgi:tether containing UBX domain for GLUT4